jgi:hypothetical protein
MTRNLAPKVEITLLMRIFAVVKPAVRVDLSPVYSIWSPPMVNLVRSFSSLWSLISTTNEPYVTFRPCGIFDLRMNPIMFVLYSLLISFAVDCNHFILYLNFVMSSWCLSDLPVSGQITAFVISCKMMTSLLLLRVFEFWVFGCAEMEKQWFSWLIVSAIISWDKLCCCLALRPTMTCGVCGVTARLAGVFCLRWEFGVECGDVFGWGDICCAVVFATLGGENMVCTLWGAVFSTPSVGVTITFDFRRLAPLKILARRFKAIVCSSPTLQNGPAGCGCNRAWVRSVAAWVAKSWAQGNGKVIFSGKNSTVSTILSPLVFVI